MKQHAVCFLLGAVLAGAGAPAGAVIGYVDDSSEVIVRTGHGDCLHTGRWSQATAVAECDPEIVAARERAAAAAAAMEVVAHTELRPLRLDAEVLFGFDSDVLTDAGKARLDDMLGSLDARSLRDQKIQITGYTDRIGPAAYNQRLSERRAGAVYGYLVTRGVVPAYIERRGLGPANPRVACAGRRGADLVACLAPNRRAEVEFSAVEAVEVEARGQ